MKTSMVLVGAAIQATRSHLEFLYEPGKGACAAMLRHVVRPGNDRQRKGR